MGLHLAKAGFVGLAGTLVLSLADGPLWAVMALLAVSGVVLGVGLYWGHRELGD